MPLSPSPAFIILATTTVMIAFFLLSSTTTAAADDTDAVADRPQQVHLSLAGPDKMQVTYTNYITGAIATVHYGTSPGSYTSTASGITTRYSFLLYHSPFIHHVIIGPLAAGTTYYYRCGSVATSPEFSFIMPPSNLPLKFSVAGDLGQSAWTSSTLRNIAGRSHDIFILPGDISYANYFQPHWDSFGRFVEPFASSRPWMVTEGNHDIEGLPPLFGTRRRRRFTAYKARWRTAAGGGSGTSLYYSFDAAGGAVHVVMLGSYAGGEAGFGAQQRWLEADLRRVDRVRTPWVVAALHAPWYNSNAKHQGDGEAMRAAMERLLYSFRVDIVVAGHVHAYERFRRVYRGRANACGPVYVTVGSGGNKEGLARRWVYPRPAVSMFRESSFGHGELEVVNATHARWGWYRNDVDQAKLEDEVWLVSLVAKGNPCNN